MQPKPTKFWLVWCPTSDMPATKRTIALQIVATDTHCGDSGKACQHLDRGYLRCDVNQEADLKWDSEACEFRRLPECIAAEKTAKSCAQ